MTNTRTTLALLTATLLLGACTSTPGADGRARRTETRAAPVFDPVDPFETERVPTTRRALPVDTMTEADRIAWHERHRAPSQERPQQQLDQSLRPIRRVEYVNVRPPRERWLPPVHLSLGYSRGHHGHRGWHSGIGWAWPLYLGYDW